MCPCPLCGKFTKGEKIIGLYKAQLTGFGQKVLSNTDNDNDETDDDDDDEKSTAASQTQGIINFKKIVQKDKDGFLKMDGKNGKFVKWYFMNLTI